MPADQAEAVQHGAVIACNVSNEYMSKTHVPALRQPAQHGIGGTDQQPVETHAAITFFQDRANMIQRFGIGFGNMNVAPKHGQE